MTNPDPATADLQMAEGLLDAWGDQMALGLQPKPDAADLLLLKRVARRHANLLGAVPDDVRVDQYRHGWADGEEWVMRNWWDYLTLRFPPTRWLRGTRARPLVMRLVARLDRWDEQE